jgi:hypothetical protein
MWYPGMRDGRLMVALMVSGAVTEARAHVAQGIDGCNVVMRRIVDVRKEPPERGFFLDRVLIEARRAKGLGSGASSVKTRRLEKI